MPGAGMWPAMNGYPMYSLDATRCGMAAGMPGMPGMPAMQGGAPMEQVPVEHIAGPLSTKATTLDVQGKQRPAAVSKRNARNDPNPRDTPPTAEARERVPLPWLNKDMSQQLSQQQSIRARGAATRDFGSGGGPKRTDYAKRSTTSVTQATSNPITTMMLRHIPCRKTQEEVMSHIDSKGFQGRYDFLYLPSDTRCGANLGYAFVNFLTPEDAERFKNEMDGYRFSGCGSAKACAVNPAHVQGLQQNLATFKRMEVMRSARKPFFIADSHE